MPNYYGQDSHVSDRVWVVVLMNTDSEKLAHTTYDSCISRTLRNYFGMPNVDWTDR